MAWRTIMGQIENLNRGQGATPAFFMLRTAKFGLPLLASSKS